MKFYTEIKTIFLLLFIMGGGFYFKNGFAVEIPITESYVQREILPNEPITFDFITLQNQFTIETDVFVSLYLEYHFFIFFREASLIINNSEAVSLNVTCIFDLNSFLSQLPEDPMLEDLILTYQYNCIYQLYSNSTIERLTFRFMKMEIFGLDPFLNYSLALFEEGQSSWVPITTLEKNISGSSDMYLEGSLSNMEADKEYYFTLYDIEEEPQAPSEDWIPLLFIILIPSIIILIGIIIVVSKEEYLDYIKKRLAPINRGAHRLTLKEVLDNENRNKIIDLILEYPGIHFNELLRKTGLTPGSLVWHLTVLETYKIIDKKSLENYVVYFPYYQKNPISNIDLKLKKSDLTLKILDLIENDPGIWNNKITNKLKINRKTIEYHIEKLIELNLIKKKKEGNKKHLYVNLDSEYFRNKKNSKEMNQNLMD
jgi:DNA-binding transcriptional ArsR family regulator